MLVINLKKIIKRLFSTFKNRLNQLVPIDDSALFIDGTKLLANTNKCTFVWKKIVEKFEPKLDSKSNELYIDLIQNNVNISVSNESKDALTSTELNQISSNLNSKVFKLNDNYKDGKNNC